VRFPDGVLEVYLEEAFQRYGGIMSTGTIILIIVLVLLFGGGGGYYWSRR
jgi:hypothetical protein